MTITILDGGMGQELLARSADPATGLWSAQILMDEPDLVRAVHADYLAAGADVLFIEAPQSREELVDIAQHFQGVPLFANIIEGGKTPNLSLDELEEMGYKLVAYALSGLFSATQAFIECFDALKKDGGTQHINRKLSFEDFKTIIRMDGHIVLEKRFGISKKTY